MRWAGGHAILNATPNTSAIVRLARLSLSHAGIAGVQCVHVSFEEPKVIWTNQQRLLDPLVRHDRGVSILRGKVPIHRSQQG